MQTIRKEYEIEIGKIRYSGEIYFWYYPGKYSIDPTEGEDADLRDWQFGPIHGWDMEEEEEFTVESEQEIAMVVDWLDIPSLFEKAIS